jgi:hypothetical protein
MWRGESFHESLNELETDTVRVRYVCDEYFRRSVHVDVVHNNTKYLNTLRYTV